jgi:hypothetical protein
MYREDTHEMVAEKDLGYGTLLSVFFASSPATRSNHSVCIATPTVNVVINYLCMVVKVNI